MKKELENRIWLPTYPTYCPMAALIPFGVSHTSYLRYSLATLLTLPTVPIAYLAAVTTCLAAWYPLLLLYRSNTAATNYGCLNLKPLSNTALTPSRHK